MQHSCTSLWPPCMTMLHVDKEMSCHRSTAQLMTWNDDKYHLVMDQIGRRRTRVLAKAHRDAIASIAQVKFCVYRTFASRGWACAACVQPFLACMVCRSAAMRTSSAASRA